MERIEDKDFPFYRFKQLSGRPDIRHFVSSDRKDIGFAEAVDPAVIRRNRMELAQVVGIEVERWVIAHQIHSANVVVVGGEDAGRGALDRESRIPDADALVTDREGICLMVFSADCVPVLLFDSVKKVIAAVHAGWRGTAAQIVVRTVEKMRERYGSCPADIRAGIGPSIGKCCFEVEEGVAAVFRQLFPAAGSIVSAGKVSGKYQVDLWEANRLELLTAGLKAENIEVAGLCTVCHPEQFFSYRRDGSKAGRFGAGIMLCFR